MPANTTFAAALTRVEGGLGDVGELIGLSDRLTAEGAPELSVALYKFWLLANPEHPLRHVAAFNCGSQLLQSGDFAGAQRLLGEVAASKPDFAPARLNLASAYERAGDMARALNELQGVVQSHETLSSLAINYKVMACKSIARIDRGSALAVGALRLAIDVEPNQPELVQHWVSMRQGRCDWPVLGSVGKLSSREVLERLAPLSLAWLVDDPLLQLGAARRYTEQMRGAPPRYSVLGAWPAPGNVDKPRLRIGYLSSDICNHAVGYLMSDVFEHHDKNRFEIAVFNIGPRTNDGIQQKALGLVDHWVDLHGVDDKKAAASIVAWGADILVDMNGHTNYQRTAMLALKPAPIIANWLGYPGTMGSDDHHYLIADDFLVPPESEVFYSEKVVRLPCYQPNGRLQQSPPTQETRASLGLPEEGVVYCCFNGSVKITEPVFSRWMQILGSVPGSVLWLRGSADEPFAARLQAEAARRGIAPARLVFLSFRSNTEYLACHRFADVFLDTFPYGAHTTASDALRAGVPIVTLAGLGFASRVCGSLCRSVGMGDLVVDSPQAYVGLAIDLGRDADLRARIKARLLHNLPTSVLFDCVGLVTHLERLFESMWRDFCAGEMPTPGLRGLTSAQIGAPDPALLAVDQEDRRAYARRLELAGLGGLLP